MSAQIQLKRATAAAWASADPVLAAGEPGYETDTEVLRIGDGVTAWSSLPGFSAGGGGGGGDASWTVPTLTNSWVPYGAPFASPAYRKLSSGLVILRGAVKNGTIGVSTAQAVFQLPVGYRPASGTTWAAQVAGDSGNTVIRVDSSGYVIPAVGLNSYVSLDVVNFYAEG